MQPNVSVLMLSWLRLDLLLQTLKRLPKTCALPLHLTLRVQGKERLSEQDIKSIEEAASGFHSTDIYYTFDNVGTAAARLDLLHRAATKGFKYLMFTDDDITFPDGGIEQQIKVLDTIPEVGTVSLRPHGIKAAVLTNEHRILRTDYSSLEGDLVEVFIVGSASLMFRTELYTKYLVAPDSAYYIGTWDWDFILQIRTLGYAITVLKNYVIKNHRGGTKEYRRKRANDLYIRDNHLLMMKKWGFSALREKCVRDLPTKQIITANLRNFPTLKR